MMYNPEIHFKAVNTEGAKLANPISPKPIGQIINCFPKTTPATKGKAERRPYFAPVAIKIILAGPGVPIWVIAKIKNPANATLIVQTPVNEKRDRLKTDPLIIIILGPVIRRLRLSVVRK